MKKRFTIGTMLVVALALVLSSVAGSLSLYLRQRDAAARGLREQLLLLEEQWRAGADPAELAAAFRLAAPDQRLTIIAADGTVLADTGSGTAENHSGRPEVVSARANLWGEAIRSSETLGYPMLYVAKSLDGQTVLRAAMPLSSVESLIWESVPALLAAALGALLLAFLLSRRMAARLVKPLNAVDTALREALEGRESAALAQYEADDELWPILRDIRHLVERLREDLGQIRAERDKVALVLDCMDEGLILLDEEENILAINRAARTLFGLPERGEGGAPVLLRSRRVRQAVEEAGRTRTPVVLDLRDPALGERELRLFLSPVSQRRYEGRSVGTALLISDVTELKRAEQIRSEFTANVSHELKTPLTSIRGSCELLSKGLVKPEDQGRFFTLINVEVDRLISLINDILELSELESVTIHQSSGTASPLAVAGEAAALIAGEAAEKGITVRVRGEEGQVPVDPGRLKELLLNLMENAVRYGREGGGVEVEVSRTGTNMAITVTDDGIGIPEEAQAHIFERFYRVDKSRSRQSGGTGLGLAIVKHICRLYGGGVSVRSTPGVGSVFTVTLPAA